VVMVPCAVGADVRIIDAAGNPSNAGLVQVKLGGGYGSVCGMSAASANVACRQAGFRHGSLSAAACSTYGGVGVCGSADSAVAMKAVKCVGHEATLQECPFSQPDEACASHLDDSVLFCTSKEAHAFTPEGMLRLVGSGGAPSLSGIGRVEVFDGYSWAPVCADGWTATDEAVACAAMGYGGVERSLVGVACGDVDGANYCGDELPGLSEFACTGGEASLMDCPHEGGWSVFCSSEDGVALHCAGEGNAQGRPATETPGAFLF